LFFDANTPLPKFPVGGIMVLAHDWGTVGDFNTYAPQDAENLNNPTWRNMLSFFVKTGINPKECFFTNFFVGLRTGKSSVGIFPGIKDASYVKLCQEFFVEQVEMQKPKLILVLGAHVPKLIANTSNQLSSWRYFDTFKKLDEDNLASFSGVKIGNLNHTSSVVALVHPCYRQLTAKSRSWKGFAGDEAEVQLVKNVLASCNENC
jgi:hypothetical protein